MLDHAEVLKIFVMFGKRESKIFSNQAMGHSMETAGFSHRNPQYYGTPEYLRPGCTSQNIPITKDDVKTHVIEDYIHRYIGLGTEADTSDV